MLTTFLYVDGTKGMGCCFFLMHDAHTSYKALEALRQHLPISCYIDNNIWPRTQIDSLLLI